MAQTLDLRGLSDQAMDGQNAALQASLISADPNVQLTVANSLWIDQNNGAVEPTFSQMDETYYGALLGNLAGAPASVNDWADSETHGTIPVLLPAGEYPYPIIANVLYFKGKWATSFDTNATTAAPFTLDDGSLTIAQLMHETGQFDYASANLHGNAYQALRIPYGQARFSMLMVLPDVGVSVANFVQNMTIADLASMTGQLQPTLVSIAMPRFTSAYQNNLVPVLAALGMGDAFHPSADFSALAPAFWVNDIEHKTLIEVDETGTVAAAATAISTITLVPPQVAMDHPFFYAIQDNKTGALIFIGVLMNPN